MFWCEKKSRSNCVLDLRIAVVAYRLYDNPFGPTKPYQPKGADQRLSRPSPSARPNPGRAQPAAVPSAVAPSLPYLFDLPEYRYGQPQ